KEEKFQVVIDVIKNTTCSKAFTISADVLKIYMQQFWYTIKKVQGTDSYDSFWSTRSEESMLKSLERFWIFVQEFKEYGLAIPDVMLNDAIKQSESYQIFIKYFTAADIMQALKESNKTSKRQPGTRGSIEGTNTIQGVPDESTVVFASSDEGTSTKPGVPDKKKVITKEKVILEWGSKQESEYLEEGQLDNEEKDDKEGDANNEGDDHISDTQDTNDEDDELESDEDEIYKYKIRVRKDEDVEMTNSEVEDYEKGDAEISDDTTDAEISSLFRIKIQSKVLYIQSSSVLIVPVSVNSKPSVLIPVQETSSTAPVTTLPLPFVSTTPHVPQQTITPILTPPIIIDAPIITSAIPESDALSAVHLRVKKLKKDVFELKKIDHSAKSLASLKLQVPMSIDKATLKEYDQKIALYQTMHENKSFKRNNANHRLYHALMEALIEEENAMDKRVANTVKDHKQKNDDDDDNEDPPAGPNQGKKTKRRRTKESESSKKPSFTKETDVIK
nr:hypothetical protein [Tanacetum cinerariifolium]